jgi:hypothetical protein
MQNLFIKQLKPRDNNYFFSLEGIVKLLPNETILNYNWLITDYSGDESAFQMIEMKNKNGEYYMWVEGYKLLEKISNIYLYEGVLTGFSPLIKLEDILTFNSYPEWKGWNKNVYLPYIQHPLGELELLVEDSSYYSIMSDNVNLLAYIENQCQDFLYDGLFKERHTRKFGQFHKQQKLPTGVGNWWLEFNGKPISFEVLDGNVAFENQFEKTYPDWVTELVGRFIILPNLQEIRKKGKLEIKYDLPIEAFQEVDVISGEWNTGQQYKIRKSIKGLNFGVAQYFDESKATKIFQSIYGSYALDNDDLKFPAYFIENTKDLKDLRFVLAWGYLFNEDSLSLDFACDFLIGNEIEYVFKK